MKKGENTGEAEIGRLQSSKPERNAVISLWPLSFWSVCRGRSLNFARPSQLILQVAGAMRSLLVAALAALACCTFYAEALSFLSRPQTPRAFVELLGSPGPSSAPEAKSDEQGYSLERSAEETEEKDTSASAGSQAEGHKASAQEQNQLAAEAQEGSANETDQEQAASDADSSSSAAEQQAVEGAADEGQQKAAAGSEQQRTSSQAAENEKHSNADSGDHQNSASSRSSSEAEPQGSEDGSANEGSNSSAAEPAAAAGHTEQQPSDRSLTAGNSDSALAVTETLNPQNRRVQSIAPHAAAEDSASGSNAQEPLRVEEITASERRLPPCNLKS